MVAVAFCRRNPLWGQVRPRFLVWGSVLLDRPKLDPKCESSGCPWPGPCPLRTASGPQELNGVQCPGLSQVALPTYYLLYTEPPKMLTSPFPNLQPQALCSQSPASSRFKLVSLLCLLLGLWGVSGFQPFSPLSAKTRMSMGKIHATTWANLKNTALRDRARHKSHGYDSVGVKWPEQANPQTEGRGVLVTG